MKHLINSFVAAVFTFGIGTTSVSSGTENSSSTAYGYRADLRNTSVASTAIGVQALERQTNGFQNVAVGGMALRNTTTGELNTAIGRAALVDHTTGESNVAVGTYTLYGLTTGSYNTAIGQGSLSVVYCCSGSRKKYNTAIGALSGSKTNGSKNVFIGYRAGYGATGSNKLYIDNSDTKKPLVYGDFLKNTLKVNGRMYATKFIKSSDARLKTDIRPLNNALDTVLSLQGKQYRLIDESVDQTDIGLIAQDVEKVLPQIVSQTEDGYKAIDYQSLTTVLIEAMKEQQGQIMILEKENTELKALVSGQMEQLLARVAMLEGNTLAGN